MLYYYDREGKQCKPYYLDEIPPTLKISETKEVFDLKEPDHYENHLPVFIIRRSFPCSIQTEWVIEEDEEVKKRMKGYDSDEIDARIQSIYTNEMFRRTWVSKEWIIAWIISILLAIVSTMLFTMPMQFRDEPIEAVENVETMVLLSDMIKIGWCML